MKLSFVTAATALTTTGLVLACVAIGSALLPFGHAPEGLTASAMSPGQIDAYDACLRDHAVIDQSWSATAEVCRQKVEASAVR